MSQFMLLLYDQPAAWQKLSAEEMQQWIQKYMAWSNKPINRGGKRLAENVGKVIRGQAGGQPKTSDGPYSETKEVLGGFYTIEADDYDHAVQLTLDHPHLEWGGTIEVRQIWGT